MKRKFKPRMPLPKQKETTFKDKKKYSRTIKHKTWVVDDEV